MRNSVITGALSLLVAATGCDSSGKGGNDGGADAGIDCPEGSVLEDGACLFDCLSGWTRNEAGACEPPCPEGWSHFDEACAPPCPEGMEEVDGGPACRPPEESVGPRPCSGEKFDAEGSEETDAFIYVDAIGGSDTGEGTEASPFQTLEHTIATIGEEEVVNILLAAGEYEADDWMVPLIALPATFRVLGACAEDVVFKVPSDFWNISQEGRVEIARVNIDGDRIVADLGALSVRDCFVNGQISWQTSDGESLEIAHNIFAVEDEYCLALYGGGERTISNNIFQLCDDDAVSVSDDGSLVLSDNWFQLASDQGAVSASCSSCTGSIEISRSWVSGGTVPVFFLTNWGGAFSAQDIHFSELGSNAFSFINQQNVELSGIVAVTAADAEPGAVMSIVESSGVTISGSAIVGRGGYGVAVSGSIDVSVLGSHVSGCADSAIYSEDSFGTIIDGCVLTTSGLGLEIDGGDASAHSTLVGANHGVGVRVRFASEMLLESCTVASNASTGIEFGFLTGDSDSAFDVAGCEILDNVGFGVVVRSGGEGRVAIAGSTIAGTRPGIVESDMDGEGSVGDGVCALTGWDGVRSRILLQENTIYGNSRLGILLHGEGTEGEVNDNAFGEGNGYDGQTGDLIDGPADFIEQCGATAVGTNAVLAQIPTADLYANPGGGDPHMPGY